MNECLNLKEANCKNCHKCIRHCPVKAISFQSNQAHILQDSCILCGQCFVNCPQNAKSIRSDLPAAKKLLAGDAPVYASVAPSFAANYNGKSIQSIRDALLKLGFADVEEAAVGATIVKNHYEEMVDSGKHPVIISSCCHTVNLLIQRYYPGALPYLAKVQSPMAVHSAEIKRAHPGARTVFIGPCISKKAEAEQYPGIVDCVLTFEELTEWLSGEDVAIDSAAETEQGGKARLFPLAGGILRSMRTDNKDYRYLVIDGMENCVAAIEDISNGALENCFIEMSACKGSCIGGPAMEHGRETPVSAYLAVDSQAGELDFKIEMPPAATLEKDIPFQAIHAVRPGSTAIEKALRQMGKTKPSDELNCGSCGYNTCREKAVAIITGKADPSMCLPYLMERAQSFSDIIITNTPDGIIVLNETLEIQQINNAACAIMNIKQQQDVLGRPVVCVLDPEPFAEVLENCGNIYDRLVFMAEYGRYVMLTVVYDRGLHIMFCIMRDVTEPETERTQKAERDRKTIEITDKVIEKQMRTVQEIASLLGETTAETKIALTKLKETLQNE